MENKNKNFKDVIRKEYVKCAQDPVYFLKKYSFIQHPIKGKIPFHLYDFQLCSRGAKDFQEFSNVFNN